MHLPAAHCIYFLHCISHSGHLDSALHIICANHFLCNAEVFLLNLSVILCCSHFCWLLHTFWNSYCARRARPICRSVRGQLWICILLTPLWGVPQPRFLLHCFCRKDQTNHYEVINGLSIFMKKLLNFHVISTKLDVDPFFFADPVIKAVDSITFLRREGAFLVFVWGALKGWEVAVCLYNEIDVGVVNRKRRRGPIQDNRCYSHKEKLEPTI